MLATTSPWYPGGPCWNLDDRWEFEVREAHMRDVGSRKTKTATAKTTKWGGAKGTNSHAIDLTEVDGELLRDAIAGVCLEGDAFLVGLTSDQGAVATRILSDAGKEAFYDSTTEAFESTLRCLRDTAKGF